MFMPYLVFDSDIKLCTLTSSKSNCIRISIEINSTRYFCKKRLISLQSLKSRMSDWILF